MFSPIAKDVASHFPQFEREALQIALKFDMIYAQLGYVYIVIPDLPWRGVANTSGASHAIGGIVGTLSHPQAYAPPHKSYGQPQRGTSSIYNYPSPNPPHGNPYSSPSKPYAYPHMHQQMPRSTVAMLAYTNVAPYPYYKYAQPSALAPSSLAPQPPMPSPPQPQQPPPPQGQVYAQ